MVDREVLERAIKIHPSIADVPENSFGIDAIVLDERTGAAAALYSIQWYNRYGPGGTGMAKVIKVFSPRGTERSFQYTWRDQFDPSLDNDYNFIRNISLNSKESNEKVLVLDAETPIGKRKLEYRLD